MLKVMKVLKFMFVFLLSVSVVVVFLYSEYLDSNKIYVHHHSAALSYSIDICGYSNMPQLKQLMYIDDPHLKVSRDLCDHLIHNNDSSDLLDPYFNNSFNYWKPTTDDHTFLRNVNVNCTETYMDFACSHNVSKEEEDFPIAYEMLIHYKEPITQQYVRLLKNIYRPHNYYCIHIDKKSPSNWTNLMYKFAMCFPNLIVTKKQIPIVYGSVSILHAHLECFKELLKWKKWKYVISLHGTELPLMTNREIINVLKAMNGINIVTRGFPYNKLSKVGQDRLKYKVKIDKSGLAVLSNVTLGKIPYKLNVTKSASSVHSAFSLHFIKFILSNEKAIALREFLEDVQSPEEFFFCTINALPEAPGGSYNRTKKLHGIKVPVVSARNFMNTINVPPSICKRRKIIHNVCIASSSDLPRLVDKSRKKEWMFYNKYLINYDHIVMDCIENELISRNRP